MKVSTTKLAGAMALAVIAGGCAKKVGGQVVAIVDGQEVTQQELNGELNGAAIPATADRKAILAQLLQRVIDRKVLVASARKQGLDQSPAYLAQIQKAQDNVLIGLMAEKIGKTLPLPDAAALDRFMAENPSIFGARKRYALDQIVFTAPKDPTLAQKMSGAHTLAQVEEVLKSSGIQYQSGHNTMDSASLPPAVAKQVAALPPGEPFLVPQNGQIVASVIRSAEAVPVTPEQAKPYATQLMRNQSVGKAMADQVKRDRASAKIEYQPGFAPPAGTPAR